MDNKEIMRYSSACTGLCLVMTIIVEITVTKAVM